MTEVTIAELLSEHIERRRITPAALAKSLHVSASSVSRWASGKMRPDPESCRAIARFFHISEADVLRAAGHLVEDSPADETPDPPWLAQLINELRQSDLSPREADTLDATLQGLLALREERAQYGAQEPPGPQPPG